MVGRLCDRVETFGSQFDTRALERWRVSRV